MFFIINRARSENIGLMDLNDLLDSLLDNFLEICTFFLVFSMGKIIFY